MQSETPKILHRLAGRSMLGHVLASTLEAGVDALAIVVGPGREDVAAEAFACAAKAEIYVQTERLGTAHAVLAARAAIDRGYDDLLVVFADTPLVRPQTFAAMRRDLAAGAAVVALGFEAQRSDRLWPADPREQRACRHSRGEGCERGRTGAASLQRRPDGARRPSRSRNPRRGRPRQCPKRNITSPTPSPSPAARGSSQASVLAGEDEVMGVNDRLQLAAAEALMQQRLRRAAMPARGDARCARDGVLQL